MPRNKKILVIIMILGAGLRLASFHWNQWPHADLLQDRQAALSFLDNRTFQIEPPSDRPFVYSLKNGRFLDQHPVLWPVLGASLSFLAGKDNFDPYASFKILSFASGMVLILLMYFLGKSLVNAEAGLVLAGLSSLSYLLIDYSANGAFYAAQAVLYLLWISAALQDRDGNYFFDPDWKKIFYFSLFSAISFMLNYQAVILALASLIYILFGERARLPEKIKTAAVFLILFFVLITPLMLRNYFAFGSPFFSSNLGYVFQKAGIAPAAAGNLLKYQLGVEHYFLLVKNILGYWLPYNLYYISRKLFILAPVIFFFFVFAMIDYLFSKELLKKMAPVLLVLGLQVAISAVWPITKFRYFVPVLPLVFLIGCEYLWRSFSSRVRLGAVISTFVFLAFFSYLTYLSVPSHTYYYDGAITSDPFGRNGEMEWWNPPERINYDADI